MAGPDGLLPRLRYRAATVSRAALLLLLTAAVLPAAPPAAARGEEPATLGEWVRGFDVGALVQLETAVDTGTARFQKAELTAQPELRVDFAGGHSLRTILRLRFDAFDRLQPGRVSSPEIWGGSRPRSLGDRGAFSLRELTLDLALGPARLTLGKQQVVWGESDGLKVLDLVDPQAFDEFILPDFDQSRIPLWTLNLEVPVGPGELQLLWIPDPSVHDLPRPDAIFAFRAPRTLPPQIPGFTTALLPARFPDDPLGDSDAGVRWRGLLAGADVSLAYLYQNDDAPVFAGSLAPAGAPGTQGVAGGVAWFEPRYERTHVVGATASTALGDFTLRGELLWRSDRVLSTRDPRAPELLHRTGELQGVVGVDWFGLRDTLLSAQLFQNVLLEDAPGLLANRADTRVTFFAEHRLLNERLVLELQWIHDLLEGDGLVRPRARYELRDGLDVWVGIDVFYGDEDGLFGQYRANDRAVVGLELGI